MTRSGFCKVPAGESDRAKEPAAFSCETLQLVSKTINASRVRGTPRHAGVTNVGALVVGWLAAGWVGARVVSQGREDRAGCRGDDPVRNSVPLAKAARAQESGSRVLFLEWPLACRTLRPGVRDTETRTRGRAAAGGGQERTGGRE